MERILFVCTGNTCRSPMAAGILRRLLRENRTGGISVASAGSAAMDGLGAAPQAISVAQSHGINLRGHRSRSLTREIAENATLILTMTRHHWYDATELTAREKVSLVTAIGDEEAGGEDIPDPFGGSVAEYEKVFDRLDAEIAARYQAIVDAVRAMRGRKL